MQKFHLLAHTLALLSSAASFKLASFSLKWAVYHKRRHDEIVEAATIKQEARVWMDWYRDSQEAGEIDWQQKATTWIDAMPEECPLCGDAGECDECKPYRKR